MAQGSDYSIPSEFTDTSIQSEPPLEPETPPTKPKQQIKVVYGTQDEPSPYLPGAGYLNPGFTDLNSIQESSPSAETSGAGSSKTKSTVHKVPEYGYAYEDWNWPVMRYICTGITLAVIIGLLAASIGLVIVFSQICYPDFRWWQGITIYRANPLTFNDADEDSKGDLAGLTERMEYVKEFGADVLLLTNVLECSEDNSGECLSLNHHVIRPLYGNYQSLTDMSKQARSFGLHVMATIPVGYTSNQHVWFKESRQMAKESPNKFTNYYIWSDQADPNRPSAFDTVRQQFYLYNTADNRPLLNWNNSYVREDMEASMVKLLRAGVQGFYLENLDKVVEIDQNTMLFAMKHIREAADHYDNVITHSEDLDGHYPRNRCIMVPEGYVKVLESQTDENKEKIYRYIDLIDVKVIPDAANVTSSLMETLNSKKVQSTDEYHLWPVWRLAGVTSSIENLHTAMLTQVLTFPGSVAIDAGAEIGQSDLFRNDLIKWNVGELMHWVPYSPRRTMKESQAILAAVHEVVESRKESLAMRSNGAVFEETFQDGYRVAYRQNQVLVLVRDFPRAENFLTIANYDSKKTALSLVKELVKCEVLMSYPAGINLGLTQLENLTLTRGQIILAKQSKWSS